MHQLQVEFTSEVRPVGQKGAIVQTLYVETGDQYPVKHEQFVDRKAGPRKPGIYRAAKLSIREFVVFRDGKTFKERHVVVSDWEPAVDTASKPGLKAA